MPLNSGTKEPVINGYNNSMAAAMESAFLEQWPYIMGDADLPATSNQMKLLFIAISQGVINHLKDNSASFEVEVNVTVGTAGTGTGTGTVTDIEITPDE